LPIRSILFHQSRSGPLSHEKPITRVILAPMGGIPPTDKVDRKEADVWISRLQAAVKDAFFPMLWSAMDTPNRNEWRALLRRQVEELYDEAARALPTRQELFYRAYDKGRGMLIGKLKQDFSDTPPPKAAQKEAA
jgi:hypothetical protein